MVSLISNITRYTAIALLIIISFRIGLHTPLNNVIFMLEIVGIILFLGVFVWRLIRMSSTFGGISQYDYFILGLCLFPIIGGLCAMSEFGQPFHHGFIHQRDFYLILSGPFLLYLLQFRVISLKTLEKSLNVVAWSALIIFTLSTLIINPAPYLETDFVGYNSLKGGYIFKFVMSFIAYGFLYHLINYFRKKEVSQLVYSLLFLAYILFVRQDRSIIFITIATGIAFFFSEIFPTNKVKYGIFLIVFFTITFTTISLVETSYFEKFKNVISLIQGEETNESSTNVRRAETALALPYIIKNPFFGNGELSNQWNGGYEKQMGYFYPADIGIIGEIFVFGILGTIILNLQFLYGYRLARKVQTKKYDQLFIVSKYFLVYIFLESLTAGQTIFYAANSVFFIAILYFYKVSDGANTSTLNPLAK
jgi:hypothetical protein